jgi:hypothetical protein
MGTFVDVVPSDAALEADFNINDYMNSMFPNEQALTGTRGR